MKTELRIEVPLEEADQDALLRELLMFLTGREGVPHIEAFYDHPDRTLHMTASCTEGSPVPADAHYVRTAVQEALAMAQTLLHRDLGEPAED